MGILPSQERLLLLSGLLPYQGFLMLFIQLGFYKTWGVGIWFEAPVTLADTGPDTLTPHP